MELKISLLGRERLTVPFEEGSTMRKILKGAPLPKGTEKDAIEYLTTNDNRGRRPFSEIWENGVQVCDPLDLKALYSSLDEWLDSKPSDGVHIVVIGRWSVSGPSPGSKEEREWDRECELKLLKKLECPRCKNTGFFIIQEGTASFSLKEGEGASRINNFRLQDTSEIHCGECRVHGTPKHFATKGNEE
tara:strand:- start:219 stop:785 length:567 start_codon:yes stop_codon:yes gene_type:complete